MIRYPVLVLTVMTCLAVISLVYSAYTLRIDTDTVDMISAEVPFRQNDIAFKQAFPVFNKPIVAVIDGDGPEQSDDAAKALRLAMEADPSHFANVDQPGDDPFFERHGLLYLDADALNELSDRLASAQPLLAALAADPNLRGLADFIRLVLEEGDDATVNDDLERLLGEMAGVTEAASEGRRLALSWRRLLDIDSRSNGDRRLLTAEPALDYDSLAPAAAAITAARSIADDLGITPANGLQLRLTGSAVLEHEELEAVSKGAIWSGLLATGGVALLLVWGLGSIRLIVATLVTLFVGLIITAGFAALMVGRLNLISVTFAVLFVGLGVDFGIHLSLRYKEEVAKRLASKDALQRALSSIGGPLTLSAICAGLGFIAFVPTDYRGLAELGIISAVGMAVAWSASLILLPALLALMPISASNDDKASTRIGPSWIERHAKIILGFAFVVSISALTLLPRVGFDFNPLNLKDPTSESVSTFLDLERNPRTAANTVNVLAADLSEADATAERLRVLPEVGDVITLSNFVPDNQAEKLDMIDSMAFFLGSIAPATVEPLRVDEHKMAFQQLLLALNGAGASEGSAVDSLRRSLSSFAEETGLSASSLKDLERRLTGYLPGLLRQLDLALRPDMVDLASLPESVSKPWINEAGEARILARPALGSNENQALAQFADAALKAVPNATGTPIIITEAGRVVVDAFIEASSIALLLILLVLVVVLRRATDVLLVLAPLALAIMFTGLISVLMGLQLNFANVIVLPLLLGLGVSGAIHVVMRRRRRMDGQPDDQRLPGLSGTERAVLFSALTTIASFGSLAISNHQGMASMGLLLTIAILCSLVCTLIILPALLTLIGQSQKP